MLDRLDTPGDAHAVSLPGHGPGAIAIDPGRGFEGAVADLAADIRARVRGRFHLAGYSMGGRVALAIALLDPHSIESLTMISASPGLEDPSAREARRREDERWIALLRSGDLGRFVNAWEAQPILAPAHPVPAARLERQRAIRLAHDPDALADALLALGTGAMPSYWEALAHLDVPVHLIAGSEDAKYLAIARRMRACLPAAQETVIDGSGHNPILEQPERLAEALQGISASLAST